MSQSTVVDTVLGCLQDPASGYVARLMQVVAARGDDPSKIRTDFRFVRLRLPQSTLPANQPNVAVRAGTWLIDGPHSKLRDGVMTVEISVEYFDADEETLTLNVNRGADAVALALLGDGTNEDQGLRGYSDTIKGPVIEVLEPVRVINGSFEGAVSEGFIATAQIQERSKL